MKRFPEVILWSIGVLIFCGVVFVGGMIATDPGDNVRLEEVGSRLGEDGRRFLTASFRNQTAYRYSLVQVEVEFLNENGDVMGSMVPVKRNLGVGETWDIEVPVRPEGAVQARMRNLTCSKTGEEPHPRACGIHPTVVSLQD